MIDHAAVLYTYAIEEYGKALSLREATLYADLSGSYLIAANTRGVKVDGHTKAERVVLLLSEDVSFDKTALKKMYI